MGKSPARQQKFLIYFACILALVLGYFLRWQTQEKPVQIPRDQPISLVAIIKTEPRISFDRQVLQVGDARVYTSFFPRYLVGDRVKIDGKVDEKGRIFNPQIEKIDNVSGLIYKIALLRYFISQNLYSLLPSREATLVVGSVLGVDNIGQQFREQLVKTGTIHVVVVSGQNLALVAGMFLALSNLVGRRKSLILATVAVFLYALLTGFAPPVVRASLMVLLASIAVFLGRETSGVWSLFLAALIILFIWPSAIFEISFQLTFAATLGILTMGQFFSKRFNRLLNVEASRFGVASSFVIARSEATKQSSKILNQVQDDEKKIAAPPQSGARNDTFKSFLSLFTDSAAIAISAYIFTTPIIWWHFGRVSLIAPLVNVLVAEAVFPIMVFGFLAAVASLFFMPLAQVFAWFAYVPALYFTTVVGLFAAFV